MPPRSLLLALIAAFAVIASASAEPPGLAYLFPAGGQRGTQVTLRVGGYYLHDRAAWIWEGPVQPTSDEVVRTRRLWFEGPLIKQPASQQKEDYPQDYRGEVSIPATSNANAATCRVWNAQGIAAPLTFVVGDLPEVVEEEVDGEPIPTSVALPVTVNGRVFPREDVDLWTFEAAAAQSITCCLEAMNGSELQPELEIRGPEGRRLPASVRRQGPREIFRFQAGAAGRYTVSVTDARYSGSQTFVYRLTLTAGPLIDSIYPLGGQRGAEQAVEVFGQGIASNRLKVVWPSAIDMVQHSFSHEGQPLNPIAIEVSDVPEVIERDDDTSRMLAVPGVANGRIAKPGERDRWSFTAAKGTPVKLEVRAAVLGSPLDSILVIYNDQQQEVGRSEDSPDGNLDSQLVFTPPADGTYTAEIAETFASRGGPTFAYRLAATPVTSDFQIRAPASLAAPIGGETKLTVAIDRVGNFKEPLRIILEGLPEGVTCAPVEVPGDKTTAELMVKVAASTPVQLIHPKVWATATIEGRDVRKHAVLAGATSTAAGDFLLVTTLATPFKFKGQYELRYVPRGGVLRKTYEIDRGGFTGPLEVSLADRQGRHLQGVHGPTIVVPANETTFEYPLSLPPWMELGRTSRTNLMLVGEMNDAAGKPHKVCFATNEQNEQMIALVSPSEFQIAVEKPAYLVRPESELRVPVRLLKRAGAEKVRITVAIPEHMRDVLSEPVEVAGNAETTELVIHLGAQPGPFNLPLTLRGQVATDAGELTAEANLRLKLAER